MKDKDPKLQRKTVLDDSSNEVQVLKRRPYLVALINDRWQSFEIGKEKMSIGRASGADIVINDDRISGIHCTIQDHEGNITIEDQGSTNGTHIDGKRINRGVVTTRSSVQLGLTVMKLEYKTRSEIDFENELFRKATTDDVTNIFNRGYFMSRASEEIAYAKRAGTQIGLVMLDIDFFKSVNDEFGHQAGDYVMRQLGVLIDAEKRTEDVLGRYGGEEFIVLIRGGLDRDGAFLFCDRIRRAIEEYLFRFDNKTIRITVSLGLCLRSGKQIKSLGEMIRKADVALYRAKQNGRNRVEYDWPEE